MKNTLFNFAKSLKYNELFYVTIDNLDVISQIKEFEGIEIIPMYAPISVLDNESKPVEAFRYSTSEEDLTNIKFNDKIYLYSIEFRNNKVDLRGSKLFKPTQEQLDAIEKIKHQYRKKPVVIEAITFDELVEFGRNNGANIVNNMPWSFNYQGHPITHENDQCYLIPTLEGTMKFTPEDMLITGVKGEIYPCKLDIFESTYEKV